MAKSLKTSVQLDTSKAVRSLNALEKKIKSVQTTIERQNRAINNVSNTYNRVNTSANKATTSINRNSKAMTQNSRSAALLTTKLKRLAGAYLGVMGAKAAITTSDTITSAENRLNALNGANRKATQASMDKMYVASQNARMRYSDMLANASKSMTLASGAFQGNMDNAIRFQEIMAKSYTLGGASAAEQSSSMYQMIQALGSGTLQGDELRSVREGAPLAYKEIEKFAQGVYNSTDSLKEMASEGKITSDIVVAAMMNAGESIDKAFENTDMTFGQAFNKIQSTAIKAFEPVLQMLNDALNSEAGQAIINGIGWALQFIAGTLRVVFTWIEKIYTYIATNWSWISKMLTVLGVMLGVYLIAQVYGLCTALQALIVKAWTAISTLVVEFITMGKALGYATAMSTLFGVTLNMWAWVLIAILAVVVIAIFLVADSFVDACGIIMGIIFATGAVIYNIVAYLMNIFIGLGKVIVDSLSNAWNLALIGFWKFVKGCLSGTSLVARAISKIAAAFGMDEVYIDSQIGAAEGRMIDVKGNLDSYFNTIKYKDIGGAYDKGYGIGSKVGNLGNWINDKLGLDNISNVMSGTPGVAGAYDMPADLAKTADNTGDMADSMKLAEEDLAYLRDLAEMEWKKEFTTANITVDMSNYNTINGDGDLDGIATRLADKLYEELHSVANGVYA